jgi:hypothetical protein
MVADFSERFTQRSDIQALTLQVLFSQHLNIDVGTFQEIVRGFAAELEEASVEWYSLSEHPELAQLVTGDGPPATEVGIIHFGEHLVKLVQCDGPLPYGPMRTCVDTALMAPEDKQVAYQHLSHILLYEVSAAPDPLERQVAVAGIAAVLASLGGSTILNEEARAAAPGPDFIPEENEDIFATLRSLPIPYLYGGIVRLDLDDPTGMWVRSFANHKLGLPNLAMKVTHPDEVRFAFELFAGILGYLRKMEESLVAGDTADLGERKVSFREPTEQEWYLESDGVMLVIEQA